jgi:hypothetical protein
MRSTAPGVLRELRRLDAKHHPGERPSADRMNIYYWLADGQSLAGHTAAAAWTCLLGALRTRSRHGLVLAARLLVTREHQWDLEQPEALPPEARVEFAWLERYLGGRHEAGPGALVDAQPAEH